MPIIIVSCAAITVFAVACAFPSIYLHLMDGHFLHTGIDKYSPSLSSISLCRYLTVREEDETYGTTLFVDRFQRSDAFFRHEETYEGGRGHEIAILVLSYEKSIYPSAFGDVSSQQGFSDEISFTYGDFEFRLNDSERMIQKQRNYAFQTDFELTDPDAYLHWINLVGWSDSRFQLAFIGFFHVLEVRSGFWNFEETFYSFNGWDSLFKQELSYFDWA